MNLSELRAIAVGPSRVTIFKDVTVSASPVPLAVLAMMGVLLTIVGCGVGEQRTPRAADSVDGHRAAEVPVAAAMARTTWPCGDVDGAACALTAAGESPGAGPDGPTPSPVDPAGAPAACRPALPLPAPADGCTGGPTLEVADPLLTADPATGRARLWIGAMIADASDPCDPELDAGLAARRVEAVAVRTLGPSPAERPLARGEVIELAADASYEVVLRLPVVGGGVLERTSVVSVSSSPR